MIMRRNLMKKRNGRNEVLLGLMALFLLVGMAGATTYECDSCSLCTIAVQGASSGDIVLLNASLINVSDSICVDYTGAPDNVTTDCQDNTINGQATGIGIYVVTSLNTIKNCILSNWEIGLYLDSGANNNTIDNVITEYNGVGIFLATQYNNYNAIKNSISRYNLLGCTPDCYNIILQDGDFNIITNVSSYGSEHGILVLPSSDNITGNVINDSIIENNSIGIYFESGYSILDNVIYNNFFNNSINFNSSNTVELNFWNTTVQNATNIIGGSQTGGNFWSKPDGTGYSETCNNSNNDSFCDDSYTFNPTDYLPLTGNYSFDTTPPDIDWNTPANNSFTLNLSSIFWNVTISEAPDTCLLSVNGSANISMLISGNDCYYTSSNLTNATAYCGLVYANDTSGNMNVSGLQCATINLTAYVPPAPVPRPIDNLGLFSPIALVTIGAGVILLILETLFGTTALLKDPKALAGILVGVIIAVAIISALL
jgi:hypothetical protein